MILFSTYNTPRLQYIIDFIANETGIGSITITTNIEAYLQADGARINYSNSSIIPGELWVAPQGLLFHNRIEAVDISCFYNEGYKAFFKTGGHYPFDIFSACFYLISRYEEYLPHTQDIYGRYAHENSTAYREGFLSLPLVNIWLAAFAKKIVQLFDFVLPARSFSFLPTYDIDEAFSYKHKGFTRTVGGIVKQIGKGDWRHLKNRLNVLAGKAPDPFDAFEWMDALHKKFALQPLYFFLVAKQRGRYDKNILPHNAVMQKLIKKHAKHYSIGLHPSWQSGDDETLLLEEIQQLQTISGKTISASRQHYIRHTLPCTYRQLLNAGIRQDYSMGYGSINGFRASICTPFYWFDLEKNVATALRLHPFCFMEANAFFEQNFTTTEAFAELMYYYKTVQAVNGELITIWHNTFLGTEATFSGWRKLYEKFIAEICR